MSQIFSDSLLPTWRACLFLFADQLREQLRTIRKRGYTLADSEVQSWLKAIAAAVFEHNGKIIASLAIVSPENLFNYAEQDKLIEILRESVSNISLDLGYHKKPYKTPLELPS